MTGTEAKKLRESYGFTLQELADILGYSHKQNIHRIEQMEKVSKLYRFALLSLIQKSNSITLFVENFFTTKTRNLDHQTLEFEIKKTDYQVFYHQKRILKVIIRDCFYEELSLLLSPFPSKNYPYSEMQNFMCIQFEYKI